jgi:hypothetical protein
LRELTERAERAESHAKERSHLAEAAEAVAASKEHEAAHAQAVVRMVTQRAAALEQSLSDETQRAEGAIAALSHARARVGMAVDERTMELMDEHRRQLATQQQIVRQSLGEVAGAVQRAQEAEARAKSAEATAEARTAEFERLRKGLAEAQAATRAAQLASEQRSQTRAEEQTELYAHFEERLRIELQAQREAFEDELDTARTQVHRVDVDAHERSLRVERKRIEAEWSERVQEALQEQAQLLSRQKKAMRSREAELTAALDEMREKLRRETTKALRLESELRAVALAM